ncbi:MAG: hypothetical protein ACLFUH_08115 [Bacteroidales bacterium]
MASKDIFIWFLMKTFDIITGETTPDLSAIEIVPGKYEEIEIELELWDETDDPSIDMDGVWTDTEGTEHPVKLLLPNGAFGNTRTFFSIDISLLRSYAHLTQVLPVDNNH